MITLLIVACVGLTGALAFLMYRVNSLRDSLVGAKQESEGLREYYEAETARVYSEAQAGVAEAQSLLDQQVAEMKQDSERVRQHYEAEARKSQESAEALVAETLK